MTVDQSTEAALEPTHDETEVPDEVLEASADGEPVEPEVIPDFDENGKPTMTPAEHARRVLQEEAQQRIDACGEQIDHILKQHGCGIATSLQWTADGRAFAGWRIQLRQ
jgi:hypothetical protein